MSRSLYLPLPSTRTAMSTESPDVSAVPTGPAGSALPPVPSADAVAAQLTQLLPLTPGADVGGLLQVYLDAEAALATARVQLGEGIRRERRALRWTQGELAAAAGVQAGDVSFVERGARTRWSVERVQRLQAALAARRAQLEGQREQLEQGPQGPQGPQGTTSPTSTSASAAA